VISQRAISIVPSGRRAGTPSVDRRAGSPVRRGPLPTMSALGGEPVQLDYPSAGAEVLARSVRTELSHSQGQDASRRPPESIQLVTPGSTGEMT